MPEPARDVVLDAVFNLRDLGGYPTADGRRTRWRRLYRGAGLHRLADDDVDVVRGLELRTVIDLRTAEELASLGGYPVAELPAAFHHLPMIQGLWDHAVVDPEAPPEAFLVPRYLEMLDVGRDTIAGSVRLLATPGALPAAFYCAAGKDRTGVLAALLLDAVGVRPEAVVEDYRLSKERVALIVARARAKEHGEARSAMLGHPDAVMDSPPEAMRLLLAAIREHHGSTRGYLLQAGVRSDELEALAVALLEPVSGVPS